MGQLEAQHNPGYFGVHKGGGAGKGMAPAAGYNKDKWEKARYWYRSACCNKRVVDTETKGVHICSECNKECKIKP